MKRFAILSFSALTCCSGFSQSDMPVWTLKNFERAGSRPIISPNSKNKFYDPMKKDSVAWESNDTFNPAAVIKNGKVVVLYRAEDRSGVGIGERTSRIGYAESGDGLVMKRKTTPVLFPAEDSQKQFEWTGGCEDPRVAVTEDGTYVMLYTQWNKKVARLGVATSRDLIKWTKHGPAFAIAYNGKFNEGWSKSASLITQLKNGKITIAKIKGKYWMYYGEQHVYAATSTDLKNWYPVLNEKGELKELMSPRKGYFDSHLTECGPPALLTDKGIVLLYNGKNLNDEGRSMDYPAGTYAAGQALFDKNDPTKFVDRLDKPFFKPEAPYEKTGQYKDGTVFIEGLVYFKNKWWLYYGCADSKVAVATSDGF